MEITIYTSNTCAYCKMAKEYMDQKGVSYEEKNVSTDAQARQELMSKGFMGVPVIVVGEETIQGFDKARLDTLLG